MEPAAGDMRQRGVPDLTIRGIGCDVEEHSAIARGLRDSAGRWAARVLTPEEQETVSSRPVHRWGADEAIRTAEIWSAKESVAKAVGVRDRDPWCWKDVVVAPPAAGSSRRQVRLLGTAAAVGARAGITALRVRTGRCGGRSWATAIACAEQRHRGSRPTSGEGKTSMSTDDTIIETIREVLDQHGHLARGAAELSTTESLYAAGMTSHASVNVMLGIEDEFDLEFPEEKLTKETFESIDSIAAAVAQLQASS